MSDKLPTAKELKKLADSCRKAGIKAFKGYGIEFTLSDDAPTPTRRRKPGVDIIKRAVDDPNDVSAFISDELTEEALLFWSTGDIEGKGDTQ